MDEIKKYFGINLKRLRVSKKLTQEKLAEYIDVNQRQLTRIETGRSFPSFNTLDKICCTLDVDPTCLFDFSEYREVAKTGTDNVRYIAKRNNNVILLNEYKDNKTSTEAKSFQITSEESMIGMAKRLNKFITVDYFDENGYLKSIVYNPDGSFKVLENENKNEIILNDIKNEIEAIKASAKKLKFISLALNALEDRNSAEKLQNIIEGMLLQDD